jgi:hypothetical protein
MHQRQRIILLAAVCVMLAALGPAVPATETGEVLPPARVIGGSETQPGQYPFLVAVVDRNIPSAWHGLRCGGSVIAPEWVLTAASCVTGLTPARIDVVAGRHDLHIDVGVRLPVTAIHIHPGHSNTSIRYDAALLRVSQPLPVERVVLPGAEAPQFHGRTATVVGWGDTHTDDRYPRTPRHTQVVVAGDDLCAQTFGSEYDPASMLCAGDLEAGGRDACRGDEGGPLLVRSGGEWMQIGLYSWGVGCGRRAFPGVYTEMAALLGWIHNTTGQVTLTCNGLPATIVGTDGPDTIHGTDGDDVIVGLGGRDVIYGYGGNDTICAGPGPDRVDGGSGNDTIFGGEGDDVLLGGPGDDTIHGEGGNDTIRGGPGNDTIYGGDGDDTIHGDGGRDTIWGGGGNDTIHGGPGGDVIDGGPGDDTIFGDGGNDRIRGGPGNDTIEGGPGNDTIRGGAGDDTLRGGDGDDLVRGGSGDDQLFGGDGDDRLYGDTGNDHLHGGEGADHLYGGRGNDLLEGGPGDDVLWGGSGDDTLIGGPGYDEAFGGSGTDRCDAETTASCQLPV